MVLFFVEVSMRIKDLRIGDRVYVKRWQFVGAGTIHQIINRYDFAASVVLTDLNISYLDSHCIREQHRCTA